MVNNDGQYMSAATGYFVLRKVFLPACVIAFVVLGPAGYLVLLANFVFGPSPILGWAQIAYEWLNMPGLAMFRRNIVLLFLVQVICWTAFLAVIRLAQYKWQRARHDS